MQDHFTICAATIHDLLGLYNKVQDYEPVLFHYPNKTFHFSYYSNYWIFIRFHFIYNTNYSHHQDSLWQLLSQVYLMYLTIRSTPTNSPCKIYNGNKFTMQKIPQNKFTFTSNFKTLKPITINSTRKWIQKCFICSLNAMVKPENSKGLTRIQNFNEIII